MTALLVDGVRNDAGLARDRGLAYGDGLFETMACRDGEILAWERHLERLERGCAVLGLPAPEGERLHRESLEVAAGHDRAVVKLIVTRGGGGRGYRPPERSRARRIVLGSPWPDDADVPEGAPTRVWICTHPLSVNPNTAGLKHLNRLDQVLACAAWPDDDVFEGLMLDPAGRLVEGTRSNVFIVRDGRVCTPWLGRCGVEGIVRQAVIAACRRLGIEVEQRDLGIEVLRDADEVFLTNSIMGVRGVTRIDAFGAIELENGPVTRRIAEALRREGTIP